MNSNIVLIDYFIPAISNEVERDIIADRITRYVFEDSRCVITSDPRCRVHAPIQQPYSVQNNKNISTRNF